MARLEKFPYLFLLAINFMAAFQKQSAKISIDYKALRSFRRREWEHEDSPRN